MGFFSYDENITSGPLFNGVYHRHCSPLLNEVGSQQMPRKAKSEDVNLLFQHPVLNLGLLFDQVRIYGQAPSSEETQLLESLVQESSDDIKALTANSSNIISEIGRLSRQLSETSYRLAHRQKQLEFGQYFLHSQRNTARLLPRDVLEEIFLACFRSTSSSASRYTKSYTKFRALHFTAVCRRWQIIAFSMPKLWERNDVDARQESSLHLSKTRIERCYPSYYDLIIYADPMTQNLKDFLRFLTQPSTAKLRHLEIQFHVGNSDVRETWGEVMRVDLGELVEFVYKNDHPEVIVPQSAVRLKRLQLHRVPVPWETASPPSQLTTLSLLLNIHWSMLEHILSHCLALQCIFISIAEKGTQYSGNSSLADGEVASMTTLHHLETFCFVNLCEQEDLPSDLLHNFHFPRLTTFEYYVYEPRRASIPWFTSLDFIHRIRRLTLSLSAGDPTSLDLGSMLNATEGLQEISILIRDLEELSRVLRFLKSLAQSTTTSPRLQGVQFVIQRTFEGLEEYSEGFIRMVRALSGPGIDGQRMPLTHLRIASTHNRSAADLLGVLLDGCRGTGVDAKVYDLSGEVWSNFTEGFDMYVPPFSQAFERGVLR
ncbi:hypothetical protein BDN72DRAFT_962293, partial [Pluteus cervinus]